MNSYGNGSCYLINYTFTNNYKLKLGFVPLQKGFYAANIASPFLDPKTENIEKNCNGRMGFLYAMNNKDTSINNFHLLSYSQVPFYKSISISQFNKEGLFGFIVK